jgi:hypothetical protein
MRRRASWPRPARVAVVSWPEFRATQLLVRLAAAGVDFVVIGGVAVVVQASPRFTNDLDICYAPDSENLDRLGTVLTALDAKLRGVDQGPAVRGGQQDAATHPNPNADHFGGRS